MNVAVLQRPDAAERALIAAILLAPSAWAEVAEIVEPRDFQRADHRIIFQAIRALVERDHEPDAIAVRDYLERRHELADAGGLEYIAGLVEESPSAANVAHYARLVREGGTRQRLIDTCERVAKGIASGRDLFEVVETAQAALERAGIESRPDRWPSPIELPALLATSPSRPQMLIDDWLPCGYATLLAGHGGAGKSSIALGLASAIATGRRWCGLPCASRRVMYLSCEDRENVLHWRLTHIAEHEEIAPDDLASLRLLDLVGHESILYRRDPRIGMTLTPAYRELERQFTEQRAEVLIVDGVSDTFGGNENDRAEVKAFVNHLVRLVGTNGAVILVAHVNKHTAGAAKTSEGYSGSTQWHNAVRARWYLYPETESTDEGTERTGALTLALQKSNLGRDDQAISFRWDDGAHMLVPEAAPKRADRHERDEHEQWAIERALQSIIDSGDYVPAATTGNRTAYHVLSAAPEFPDTLKGNSSANRRRFWRHIEALRRMEIITESSIRRKNRTRVATLTLKPAPDMDCTDAPNECSEATP